MSEQIVIVDKNDNEIGSAERYSFDLSANIYRVAGLWVFNTDGEVLIAQRSLRKKNGPGQWGPSAGGTVEVGETYLDNVTKEAEEEIGISGVEFTSIGKYFVHHTHSFFIQYFMTKVDRPAEEFRLQPDEVEQVRWVSPDGLLEDVETNPESYVQSMPIGMQALSKARAYNGNKQ